MRAKESAHAPNKALHAPSAARNRLSSGLPRPGPIVIYSLRSAVRSKLPATEPALEVHVSPVAKLGDFGARKSLFFAN